MHTLRFTCVLACIVVSSCGSKTTSGPGSTASVGTSAAPVNYTPRIGVGVTTGSRTCIAIHNANLTAGSPVTLVFPVAPQSFLQGEIAATSPSPCPISKDVDPTVSNYDVQLPQHAGWPKLTPLIAVLGTSAAFTTGANNTVSADLDQNGKTESFRGCSAGDGIHLTVWSGNPLDGTVLWHGYYYEPNNAGVGAACTPKETAGG